MLRNRWYTENYADQLSKYLKSGEIPGAADHGRILAASRQDYATAASAVLLQDEGGNRTYSAARHLTCSSLLASVCEVTGTKVPYHDLPVKECADALQRSGLDEATAPSVATLDASIAHGDLETSSADLAKLAGRAATGPAEIIHAANERLKIAPGE